MSHTFSRHDPLYLCACYAAHMKIDSIGEPTNPVACEPGGEPPPPPPMKIEETTEFYGKDVTGNIYGLRAVTEDQAVAECRGRRLGLVRVDQRKTTLIVPPV